MSPFLAFCQTAEAIGATASRLEKARIVGDYFRAFGGGGLTDAEISELSQWFIEHTIQSFAHGRVRTVEPKIVLEITFDREQPSPRHKSGYALRFPRIVRRREDKPVAEIDTVEMVAKLAE